MQKHNITFKFSEERKKTQIAEVEEGTSILHAAMENTIRLQHNCGGVCSCSTCHVIIKQGMENLPPISDEEDDQLDSAVGLTIHSRLACQCKIHGDVTVEIPDQSIYLGH
jgi:2Fe-2S ferredoxin